MSVRRRRADHEVLDALNALEEARAKPPASAGPPGAALSGSGYFFVQFVTDAHPLPFICISQYAS